MREEVTPKTETPQLMLDKNVKHDLPIFKKMFEIDKSLVPKSPV